MADNCCVPTRKLKVILFIYELYNRIINIYNDNFASFWIVGVINYISGSVTCVGCEFGTPH